uniref:Secreted protein n=1 Tax=Tetraselmis chuii TaxID=63592 RepID=A0A6U1DHT4_9CHLO|mmetsp:Transcript_12668/g.22662  ORF Transcript_12668/g.22662 Transcript_12668/m.22662 type:complete len:182 (+) Transcript_12668:403-948(+)
MACLKHLLAVGLLVVSTAVGVGGRGLKAALGWDAKKGSCTQRLPGAEAGCDWECPKNSCVRSGVTCVKNFNDCVCEPGYFKPRQSRWTAPNTDFTGKGTQEARRVQARVARMASGELGYCLAAHGRDQMGPTYFNTPKLHSKTHYIPQTTFTKRAKRGRLAPGERNFAFRTQARHVKRKYS